jgi:MYXO-CTERM domain-containing protein
VASGGTVGAGGKSSTSDGSGGSAGGSSSSGGTAGSTTPQLVESGCSCSLGGARLRQPSGLAMLALGLAWAAIARRRR